MLNLSSGTISPFTSDCTYSSTIMYEYIHSSEVDKLGDNLAVACRFEFLEYLSISHSALTPNASARRYQDPIWTLESFYKVLEGLLMIPPCIPSVPPFLALSSIAAFGIMGTPLRLVTDPLSQRPVRMA